SCLRCATRGAPIDPALCTQTDRSLAMAISRSHQAEGACHRRAWRNIRRADRAFSDEIANELTEWHALRAQQQQVTYASAMRSTTMWRWLRWPNVQSRRLQATAFVPLGRASRNSRTKFARDLQERLGILA